jgi:hypothetical protein
LQDLRDAAKQITADDLKSHGTQKFVDKLRMNPLKRTFQILGKILIKRSREETLRAAARKKEIADAKAARKEESASSQSAVSTDGNHFGSGPRFPGTVPITPQKRNISNGSATSYGPESTDSTPTRMVKPESSIQELQGTLVYDIFDALYDSDFIQVKWARGRKNLRLIYEPYLLPIDPSNYRSCETDFICRLEDNKTKKFDHVTAIADGGFVLVTDTVSNPEKSGFWSKQRACLLFEVRFLYSDGRLMLGQKVGSHR